MKHITAFDLETHLISQAAPCPKMVCISFATRVDEAGLLHRIDSHTLPFIEQLFERSLAGETYLGGQNIAFDMSVLANQYPHLLSTIFELYDNDRILDSMIRQKLIDIAEGCYRWRYDHKLEKRVEVHYSLADLARRHRYPVELNKDAWRRRYEELTDIPVSQWPQEAIDYPMHDATSTLWVLLEQEKADEDYLRDQFRQARASFALRLISVHGLRTDRVMVARYRRETEARLASHQQTLLSAGFLANKKDGNFVRRMKLAQQYALSRYGHMDGFPVTPKGSPQLDEDACSFYNDPLLTAYQEYSSSTTVLGKVQELEQGIDLPIHTRFDELMETGRISSSNPNVQNRSAKHVGDRECFVPRRGYVYCDVDYDGLELRTWAQVCLKAVGMSRLADVLNAGEDPHSMLGADIGQIEYSDLMRRKENKQDVEAYQLRQTAKIGNFGLPAGMGEKALVVQARKKYKTKLTLEQAKYLKAAWLRTWPEAQKYFDWIATQCGSADAATITHIGSDRVRGLIPYTVAANSYFQGLGADATKDALWQLVRACYVGDLEGCRVVNYIHDQFITEVPEELGHECAEVIQEIVQSAANRWLPDVPTTAKPMLCRRWSKLAKRVVRDGRLVPWEWDEAVKAGSPGCAT